MLLLLNDFQIQKIEPHFRDIVHSDYFIRKRASAIFKRIREIEAYLQYKKTKATIIPQSSYSHDDTINDQESFQADFGRSNSCCVTRNGDMGFDLYLTVTLPPRVMEPQWSWMGKDDSKWYYQR